MLEPGTQTFISMTSKPHRRRVLQPHEKLYTKSQIVAYNGVVQVELNREFRVLVANFGIAPFRARQGPDDRLVTATSDRCYREKGECGSDAGPH